MKIIGYLDNGRVFCHDCKVTTTPVYLHNIQPYSQLCQHCQRVLVDGEILNGKRVEINSSAFDQKRLEELKKYRKVVIEQEDWEELAAIEDYMVKEYLAHQKDLIAGNILSLLNEKYPRY